MLPAAQRDGHWAAELTLRHFRTGEMVPVLYSVFPSTDGSGAVIGYGTVARDYREHKRVQEYTQFLDGELAHCLKSVLTVVRSVAQQILRNAPDNGNAAKTRGARLVPIGSATDVLTSSSWRSADPCALATRALAP